MNNKQFRYCVLLNLAIALLQGCSKTPSGDMDVEITAVPEILNYDCNGIAASQDFFIIATDAPWSVSSEADWCRVSPTEGVGESEVTVQLDVNETGKRQAVLEIRSGKETVLIKVSQESGTDLQNRIPDEYFRNHCLYYYDFNHNGVLTANELNQVSRIELWGNEVRSLQGIEFFPKLEILNINYNSVGYLNLSKNPLLRHLSCESANLSVLDLSGNPELAVLYCSRNKITRLDLTGHPKLTHLDCSANQLSELDLSHNPKLQELNCSDNSLAVLDISHNKKLTTVSCYYNAIHSLQLANPELREFLGWDNRIDRIDFSGCPSVEVFSVSRNELSTVEVSGNSSLRVLECSYNPLKRLTVEGAKLETIHASYGELTSLDLTGCPVLMELFVADNDLQTLLLPTGNVLNTVLCPINRLKELDISTNLKLEALYVDSNPELTTIYVNPLFDVSNPYRYFRVLQVDGHTVFRNKLL